MIEGEMQFNPEAEFITKETEKARKHVEQETVVLHPEAPTICVDGGYKKNESEGAPARAGGDMGYVEALLSHDMKNLTGWSAEQTFNTVYDFVTKKKNRKFGWHSDTHSKLGNEQAADHGHAGHEVPVIGCGHCQKALNNPEDYDIEKDDLMQVIEMANAKRGETQFVVLKRKHAELGTLVVVSETATVNSWSYQGEKATEDVAEGESQYFIYNLLQDQQFVAEFTEYAVETGALTQDKQEAFKAGFTNSLDKHTDVTLSKLAQNADGTMRPMFVVKPGAEKPVEFLQRSLTPDQVKAKWAAKN